MEDMDKESNELMKIFMESEAPCPIAQRPVEDSDLSSYGQQFGSSMSAIPMQSPGSQQSQAFHSMSATQMIPQDMNTGLMPSDVMMQSPPPQQQQRQRQYPQQHMGYGNGSYSGYGAGYTSQRPMAQTQLSPAATYGSFQQDGGFIGNRGEFSPTSPTNQAMPPLRSPGVPGVMSSSQSMYYANNGPYCTSPSVSPMAAQAGYTGGVGLTQSVQNPGLPLMSPEQPYISSGFPPPSATQKQMQGNVMANFFQSPHQQLMSGPVRSHQAQSGNIPQQKAMPSSPRLFPPDMKMYNMPQEGFQQMPRPTSAGYAAQFHQQRSCMFDRSASSALQQLHQAQQLKAQAGSRSTRRASNPSLGNHNLPKSPNQKSSPRSTPSPKVHSPLPGMVTSPPPTRHKAPGKEQGGKQNAGPVPSSIPPPSPKNKQSRPASKKRRVVSPPANERKAEPDVSPERVQAISPADEGGKRDNQSEVGVGRADPNPTNDKEVSPENESAEKTRRPSSEKEWGQEKDGDSEENAGINGEKAEQKNSKGTDENPVATPGGEKRTSDQQQGQKETAVEPEKGVAERSSPPAKNGDSPTLETAHGAMADAVGQTAETAGSSDGRQADAEGVVEQKSGESPSDSSRSVELEEKPNKPEKSSLSDCQSSEKQLSAEVTQAADRREKVSNSPDGKPESVTAGDARVAEKQTQQSTNPAEEEDKASEPQSASEKPPTTDDGKASGVETETARTENSAAETSTSHERESENSSECVTGEKEDAGEKRASVNESTQTAQVPKVSHARSAALGSQPTTTITAKIIAKGHSAHSNQEVVVAKTPGGQMYLIQGNLLVPVHNITVQEDKGGQGPKVIVVNPSQTAAPLKFSNLVTQTPPKAADAKAGAASSDKKFPPAGKPMTGELSAKTGKNVKPEDKIAASSSSSSGDATRPGNSEGTPKKRIGRPPGSKNKQKRDSHGQKRAFAESADTHAVPTKFARTANAIKETTAPGEGEPARKRPLEVPTIKKSGHVSKRHHRSSGSHSTVRHISVRPRGGADGDAWVCSLCGKPVNHSDLGTLYGPYMARFSRERRDSASKECRSPTKVTSPVRGEAGVAEGAPEEEGGSGSSSSNVELWVHKECAVWSHGVFMLGKTLHGLEQAVESAAAHKCSKCSELGATLACFKRGCKNIFHFACARDSGSSFNEENFTILCSSHKES